LDTDPGTPWVAVSDSDWLTITSPTTGTGPTTISYHLDLNSGPVGRTGHITVVCATLTVNQDYFHIRSCADGVWSVDGWQDIPTCPPGTFAPCAEGQTTWDGLLYNIGGDVCGELHHGDTNFCIGVDDSMNLDRATISLIDGSFPGTWGLNFVSGSIVWRGFAAGDDGAGDYAFDSGCGGAPSILTVVRLA
jgi:hypothetical protein